jgi:magnesium-transporting ATPase (P-type)
MMLDPKNLDTFEDMGGIEDLLDGLGTTDDMGDSATVLHTIPFSSEREAMGVVVERRDGKFRLFLKGVSEILSKKCVAHVVVHKDESLPNRKPDKKTAPLFSVEMYKQIMYKQILFQCMYQIIIRRIFHFAGRWILSTDIDLIVQILVFCAFVLAQIFNSVNCRHIDRKLNISEGITKNWYFITNGQNLTGHVIQDGYYHFAGGGYSNVYRGTFIRSDGRKIPVCGLFFLSLPVINNTPTCRWP